MRRKRANRKLGVNLFIIPFIGVSVTFFGLGFLVVSNVTGSVNAHLEDDALTIAQGYSRSLAKAVEAHEIVNDLLEQKLRAAGKIAVSYEDSYSSELLTWIAGNLEVDEIYYYDADGVIRCSNGKYIGWRATEGHPVHDFMISGRESQIDVIRRDTESELYYKYGYFRGRDGTFVQIGVLAERVHEFLGGFEIQRLLEELYDHRVVKRLWFVDTEFTVVGSTDRAFLGSRVTDPETVAALREGSDQKVFSTRVGPAAYNVLVPVYLDGRRIGTLGVRLSLEEAETAASWIGMIGTAAFLITYGSLLATYVLVSRKNLKLFRFAYYDSLTGLPNHRYLKEVLGEELQELGEEPKALMLVNCLGFRLMNMTFGFEHADGILVEMAKRLEELPRDRIRPFRFSADRFILLVRQHRGAEDLVSLARVTHTLFDRPVGVEGIEHHLDVNIGIVQLDERYRGVDKLLKDVWVAIDHPGGEDAPAYAFFDEEMERRLQREDAVEKELRAAIAGSGSVRLCLEYQPLVRADTGGVIGFEALSRLDSDRLGRISPLEFIGVAERRHLIVQLGELIIDSACRFVAKLLHEGCPDHYVAMNISGFQLLHDDFIRSFLNRASKVGIGLSNLEIEITESVLLNGHELVNEKIGQLKECGVRVSLDDFGTGYSSFSLLKSLRLDTIKIDRFFIADIPAVDHTEIITGDFISMAHKLGLSVVAEGVENEAQREYLREHGCDTLQGFLFSEPVAEPQALEFAKTRAILPHGVSRTERSS